MEEEQIIKNKIPINKIYKDRAITTGTFLGGPLVAGYLIAENFKAFNEPEKARNTLIYAVIITLLIFGGIFLIPDTAKVPNQLIPLLYTSVVWFLVQQYQGEKIDNHINAGGLLYNWWRVIGISIIGLIITVIPFFCVAYLSGDFSNKPIDSKIYGTLKNQIDYRKDNISESEVDFIANRLTKVGVFNNSFKEIVYVKKINDNYDIFFFCKKDFDENDAAVIAFQQLRDNMQSSFPGNKIIFNLVVGKVSNVIKRLE